MVDRDVKASNRPMRRLPVLLLLLIASTGRADPCDALPKPSVTIKLIEEVAAEKGVEISLSKVEQLPEIMKYGVMSTPGVVVDGKVVHAGGIPDRAKIAGWL